ncbi:hypothetical protein DPMN_121135 [Dreissena polymorpha]|uniref:Uncharacterized protein n=1 Tax=Dreissena polymorpha TaxID=45954 RepID=A0A9D4GM75_DREPO|nr:hypothetical protein DPMN_121135 [Dreissena polymorpha]
MSPPRADIMKTQLLLGYLEKLLFMDLDGEMMDVAGQGKFSMETKPPPLTNTRSKKTSILLIISQVFEKLSVFMRNPYIIEQCLMGLFLQLGTSCSPGFQSVSKLLDYMWAFMQSFEIKACLEGLMLSLLSGYRFAPSTTDFKQQRIYLRTVLAIVSHSQTRRYILEKLDLFDKLKFPMYMHIKPLDDMGLEHTAPVVWWDMYTEEDGNEEVEKDKEAEQRKAAYLKSCDDLQQKTEGGMSPSGAKGPGPS